MLDGVAAGVCSELFAERWVVDEVMDGSVEGAPVLCGNDETTDLARSFTTDYVCHLCAGVGGGDYGPAARKHTGELGWHDQVGSPGSLRKEMDVGRVQQVVKPGERLQGEQGDVSVIGDKGCQSRAEGSVAAEQEMDARIVFERPGERREEFQALFGSHVARVEKDDFILQVEFGAEGVKAGVLRMDLVDIDPVGKQNDT